MITQLQTNVTIGGQFENLQLQLCLVISSLNALSTRSSAEVWQTSALR